jgi:ABC-2 type transport system ATP-binding protein
VSKRDVPPSPGPASEGRDARETAIVARGLTRRFGRVTAVDHVDLDVPRARIFGFLGPNGSGKSTTIRMLCGLLQPTSGRVTVLGHEMPRDAERLRPRLGYMTQRFSLWDDLTVRENLEFISQAFGLAADRRRVRIAAVVDEFDLGRLVGQRAGTMSGGQRQRLALAAATLHEPELLLLDEPTSAVDPQSRRDFWESLFALVARGVTILVSTHYMDEAERCHELAILAEGRLVARGAPQRLMDDIAAAVVEVEAEDSVAARAALGGDTSVLSIAQLGTRLHVLVDPATPDPAERLLARLQAARVAARATRVRASLEDVFVAATGFSRGASSPKAGDGPRAATG